jgi:hypothetical protein
MIQILSSKSYDFDIEALKPSVLEICSFEDLQFDEKNELALALDRFKDLTNKMKVKFN